MYFAGTETANQARVLAYLDGGGRSVVTPGCVCISPGAIGDTPYLSPAVDPAPWYDPDEPESGQFAGVWIESIEGLSDSPYERSVTQRLGPGSVVSQGRRASKTLTFTAWLFAADCCAAEYGLRWLTAALFASCTQCAGDDLCFLSCCPQQTAPDAPGAVEGPDGRWWDTPSRIRTLTSASLLSGPTVVTRAGGCRDGAGCGEGSAFRPLIQVTWVMDTDPQVWRQPVDVIPDTVWPLPDPETQVCNIVWDLDCCDTRRPGCSCVSPCAADERCPPPPAPPMPPPLQPDCVCLPLYVVRQCVDILPDLVPTWEDAALLITVEAGEQEMRNLSIRVWPNVLDRPPEELGECQACGIYYVTHIPAGGVLTIDGRTCTATLVCPGNVTTDAAAQVYGTAGGPLSCVTLSCGIRYTLCADVDATQVAPDATLRVALVRGETVG